MSFHLTLYGFLGESATPKDDNNELLLVNIGMGDMKFEIRRIDSVSDSLTEDYDSLNISIPNPSVIRISGATIDDYHSHKSDHHNYLRKMIIASNTYTKELDIKLIDCVPWPINITQLYPLSPILINIRAIKL